MNVRNGQAKETFEKEKRDINNKKVIFDQSDILQIR